MDLFATPHRRFNPLADRWVLVSPHRTDRPWQGREEPGTGEQRPPYDPSCYLCPGNERAAGNRNPAYEATFAFPNDFPSLRPDTTLATWQPPAVLRAEGQRGTCRVPCFHPRHDLTLARMTVDQIRTVVGMWVRESEELSPRCRSSTIMRGMHLRNFMVGFEMLGEAQRDLTAEDAARRLRAVAGYHYMQLSPS